MGQRRVHTGWWGQNITHIHRGDTLLRRGEVLLGFRVVTKRLLRLLPVLLLVRLSCKVNREMCLVSP